ncbi:hypothetical protein JQ580_25865 [Bradyrhizobium japonicum]|uniref:hypothetical protein n=1 Tax=Bradyrhizobium japonicum TaxID=375 RepID=UPI001BAE19BE|nr:hypothetical protein [Bradyrhizobium japonicum]MBR0994153.1 hypothetical protein [Bradyrhizobium japonicum]
MTSKARNTSKPWRVVGQETKSAAPSAELHHLPGKAKTPRKPDGSFAKGTRPGPGRAKGQRNRTTVMLKDAILQAAALLGQDGKGKDGLTGYLMMLASKERQTFAKLLERVLPLQLDVKESPREYTVEEAAAELNRRGLPVPMLLALAPPSNEIPVAANEDTAEDDEFEQLAPGTMRIE